MRFSKKILVLLAVIALLTVALPLSSAFADPATNLSNPTIQQTYPIQQGQYYYPGYSSPWWNGPNTNYQPNYDWYNGGNNGGYNGGYGWNRGWGCW